jgi:anti-anti-sigma regulatory factor
MLHKHGDLSQQMYHRIYRLSQHHSDPRLIAAALKLPYKTVQNVLDRFASSARDGGEPQSPVMENASVGSPGDDGVVVAVFPKSRYAVIDVAGQASGRNANVLREELAKALAAGLDFKALAVRLGDVTTIDEAAVNHVMDFLTAYSAGKGRYVALLDPSPVVDGLIERLHLEDRVPVFGTERAFEEASLKTGVEHSKKRRGVHGSR